MKIMIHGAISYDLREILELISNQPTLWPFLFFLPNWAALSLGDRTSLPPFLIPLLRLATALACILTLASAFGMAAYYLGTNFFYNSYSTLCSTTSWCYVRGSSLYSEVGANTPYSLPYGPYGFLIASWFQGLLDPSFFSSKLPSFLAISFSWIFLYLALRKRSESFLALTWTALAVALAAPLNPAEFWVRPDSFMTFAVAAGIWASTRREAWGPPLLGLMVGFAIDLKFYAVVFFAVPIMWSWRTHKTPRLWISAAVIAAVIGYFPFASPHISLRDYLQILKMDSGTRVNTKNVVQYLQWSALLGMIAIAPLYLVHRESKDQGRMLWRNADLLIAMFFSLGLILAPSAKDGADAHHLLPLLPVVVFLCGHLYVELFEVKSVRHQWNFAGVALFVSIVLVAELSCIVLSAQGISRLFPLEMRARGQISDLLLIARNRPPSLLLNAATQVVNPDSSSFRAFLVFHGMPRGIEPSVTNDYKSLGKHEPKLPLLIDALESEYHLPIVWVCEKGVTPFSGHTLLFPNSPAYSDLFRDDFYRLFHQTGSTQFFDIYERK